MRGQERRREGREGGRGEKEGGERRRERGEGGRGEKEGEGRRKEGREGGRGEKEGEWRETEGEELEKGAGECVFDFKALDMPVRVGLSLLILAFIRMLLAYCFESSSLRTLTSVCLSVHKKRFKSSHASVGPPTSC
eukprot:768807-Hanusia_phi.AAC.3